METPSRVYIAPEGYEDILAEELALRGTPPLWRRGRLFGMGAAADTPSGTFSSDPVWVQNIWRAPRFIPVTSIAHAAKELKAMGRNWAFLPLELHRRAALITEKLPHRSAKPFVFGSPVPTAPMGGWTLWDNNLILASPDTSSPFANGEVHFDEDKEGPPSRAYLKLWECFTLTRHMPKAGEHCIDLGSCPGGWTWVLAQLGATVLSMDKAPLDPAVEAMPTVSYRKESAFAADPKLLGPVDWLFSDVICYPARLVTMIRRWLDAGVCRNFVCTIKFQGETDHAATAELASIPGSRILHLSHNKHELTWVLLDSADR
ncbi:hypothetical protein LJC23_03030 [Desulfovibrio sp. OttesenSCG-928-I05]|nr:hypothetical protein [Desulfovibrio sp. OttesenSCG-928-I05]